VFITSNRQVAIIKSSVVLSFFGAHGASGHVGWRGLPPPIPCPADVVMQPFCRSAARAARHQSKWTPVSSRGLLVRTPAPLRPAHPAPRGVYFRRFIGVRHARAHHAYNYCCTANCTTLIPAN